MSSLKNPWDKVYKERGAFFEKPHEDMAHIVPLLAGKRARRVLDLGCGSGRKDRARDINSIGRA